MICGYHGIKCDYKGNCIDCPHTLNQRWVPVSERLPEPRQYVLISTDDAYLKRINPCLGWCDGKYWYAYTANGAYSINYPIAWMPLPEPYKEDEE